MQEAGNAREVPADVLRRWGRDLGPDIRVVEELGLFGPDGPPALSEEYRRGLATRLRTELFGAAGEVLFQLASGSCEPFVSVSFPATEEDWHRRTEGIRTWSTEDAEGVKDLEGSLVRTESLSCIETTADDPSSALTIYTSPEFRKAAEPRIEEIRQEKSETCVRTGGVFGLLDPTSSCSRTERLDLDNLASHHSQVVANPGGDEAQVVYFKESRKTVVRIPGGLAVHHVNHSRSVSLGRLERWIGGKKVRESEEETLALLRE